MSLWCELSALSRLSTANQSWSTSLPHHSFFLSVPPLHSSLYSQLPPQETHTHRRKLYILDSFFFSFCRGWPDNDWKNESALYLPSKPIEREKKKQQNRVGFGGLEYYNADSLLYKAEEREKKRWRWLYRRREVYYKSWQREHYYCPYVPHSSLSFL